MGLHKVRLGDVDFSFAHWREFLYLYFEIFIRHEYVFQPETVRPLIVDCGSHQGLSILFFKKKFPGAKILAFEPDPENFSVLKTNIAANKLRNVKAMKAAVGKKNGPLMLYSADTDKPSWGNTTNVRSAQQAQYALQRKIRSLRLSQVLPKKVDLLKMDIEGAELEVIQEIEKKLPHIREIVMETHSKKIHEDVVRLLEKRGFQTHFRTPRRIILGKLANSVLRKPSEELGILRAIHA